MDRALGARAGRCGRRAGSDAEAAPRLRELLVDLPRQSRAELPVEFLQVLEGRAPLSGVAAERLAQARGGHVEAAEVQRPRSGHITDRGVLGAPGAPDALHHPLEHADVVAV